LLGGRACRILLLPVQIRPPVVALLLAAGCPSPLSTTGVGNNGGSRGSSSVRRGDTSSSGGASDGGGSGTGSLGADTSSAASTASPSASSSAAQATSSSAAPVCNPGGGADAIFQCDSVDDYEGDAGGCPGDWFGSQLIDYQSCASICGATVQALDPAGVPIEGTAQLSDPVGGTFHFCLPAGATFETAITAPGYGTYYYGEIQGQLSVHVPAIGLLSAASLSAFAAFIPGGFDPARGAIAVPTNASDLCVNPDKKAGFVVSLTDADGGAFPDGGYQLIYLSAGGFPDPSLTATSTLGIAIVYDIDPAVTTFPTLRFSNPDAGACQEVVNEEVGFTGRVEIAAGVFSEQGIFLR
jgi:hypothetical protein